MPIRPVSITVCLLTLLAAGGCGRHGGDRRRAADEPTSLGARVNAAGENPNWSAAVRPGSLLVSIGDATTLQVKPTAADHGKDGATWSGALPGAGGTVSLAVSPKTCKDGETGLAYPMTAIATVQGRRYGGCAAHPGQGLGPRT